MTLNEIKTAVDAGVMVHWANDLYLVIKDSKGQYFIECMSNNNCIGLTRADGKTLNGKENEFYKPYPED